MWLVNYIFILIRNTTTNEDKMNQATLNTILKSVAKINVETIAKINNTSIENVELALANKIPNVVSQFNKLSALAYETIEGMGL